MLISTIETVSELTLFSRPVFFYLPTCSFRVTLILPKVKVWD